MRALPVALLAALTGCDNPFGFGGQELEMDGAQEDTPRAVGLEGAVEAACFDTGGPMERGVTALGGSGSIAVQDSGLEAQCCAEFGVSATVSASGFIEIVYADESAEPCDCSCPWSLAYTLTPVDPGEWTISVDGLQATATVR